MRGADPQMAKGVVLAGLARRREAEAAMFMRGVRAMAADIEAVRVLPPPEEDVIGLAPGGWSTIIRRQPEWREVAK